MCDKTVQFNVLCSMLEAVSRSKKPALKRKHLRTFLDHVYTDREYFSALRLILPAFDRDRGTYGLKEAVLAKCLADALGLAKESQDAQKLHNWRKGANSKYVGNFPLVAAEVLYSRQTTTSGDLTIKDVNDYLDKLASAQNRDEKTAILAELIGKTNAQEMRWIIMFLLKELKLGMSEKTILREFHPDAEDLFNVTCDLKLVCENLKDRKQRYKRQDIAVGKPVRPQLASRVASVEDAWRKLRGKKIVAECKFDGDRIQIHKDGNTVNFYSRNFIEHKEYTDGMVDIICKQVKIEKCILDGEMLVWNKLTNRFAEFGSNQEVAKASKDGLQTDQQLCYVAFDILYSGDSSVIHQSLHERQQLLKQVVQPLKGSLEILLPGSGYDEPRWSILPESPEEIEKFFLATVENRDEGIVLKDLDSKWEPGDRSGKWVKLKPDYVHTESDIDALIIGCYFGSGRRGGEIAQFLLGLAERSKQGGQPTKFLSFCKVGSGISDSDMDILASKLKPYLRRYEKNTKPPSFYVVTNVSKERPDFWVEQPDKSVILEITSDIRTIKSEVFATPYSLRFPRVNKVRFDKPWYDCLDVESLVEMVQSQNGNTAARNEIVKSSTQRISKQKRSASQTVPPIPSHMLVTDVSHVKQDTSVFKRLVFHFVNVQPPSMRDSLHKIVVENGGAFSMNLNDSVTHTIAAEKKGLKYQAASLHRDIIHQSWVLDCASQKCLLPLRPKYVLHLSAGSQRQEMDEYGDNYFLDLDMDDIMQLFQNLDGFNYSINKEELCYFQSKYGASKSHCAFRDCYIYYHNPIHSSTLDSHHVAEVTLKRLELEVLMRGGHVTRELMNASHMVIYESDEEKLSLNKITYVNSQMRSILMSGRIRVVKHSWLEDAVASGKRPSEESYSIIDASEHGNSKCVLTTNTVYERLPSDKVKLCKRDFSEVTEDNSPYDHNLCTPRRRLCLSKDSLAVNKNPDCYNDNPKEEPSWMLSRNTKPESVKTLRRRRDSKKPVAQDVEENKYEIQKADSENTSMNDVSWNGETKDLARVCADASIKESSETYQGRPKRQLRNISAKIDKPVETRRASKKSVVENIEGNKGEEEYNCMKSNASNAVSENIGMDNVTSEHGNGCCEIKEERDDVSMKEDMESHQDSPIEMLHSTSSYEGAVGENWRRHRSAELEDGLAMFQSILLSTDKFNPQGLTDTSKVESLNARQIPYEGQARKGGGHLDEAISSDKFINQGLRESSKVENINTKQISHDSQTWKRGDQLDDGVVAIQNMLLPSQNLSAPVTPTKPECANAPNVGTKRKVSYRDLVSKFL